MLTFRFPMIHYGKMLYFKFVETNLFSTKMNGNLACVLRIMGTKMIYT